MAEEKKNPLIGAFRSAPAKDQEPPGSKAAEPEKAVVLSKEKAKLAEKPVEKKAEKPAPAYAVKPGKAEEKPVAAPAEKRDEKKPEEKPSAAPAKPEDKKAAASAKAEEKKPAEDKGAEGMPESKKETEKKDQTDADGIPEDFRLNIVGEGTLGSVVMLPVEKIDDFEGHPFPVQDDKDMLDLVESIKKFGVLEPVTVIRSGKDPERYEMVAGHRRKHGCALAGVAQIPAIVRDMDRDSAIIYMVDSNLKRENISPMVKARAYTMKLEAMKRKAGRPTKAQVEAGYKPMRADEQLAQQTGESRATIQREDKIPSGAKAAELKKESQAGKLTAEKIEQTVAPSKREMFLPLKVTFTEEELRPYFPKKDTTIADAKRVVFEALDLRQRALNRQKAKAEQEKTAKKAASGKER